MRTLWIFIFASLTAKFVEGNSYKFLAIDCQDSVVFQTKKCAHNETVLNIITTINGSLNKINVELFFNSLQKFHILKTSNPYFRS